MEPKPVKEVPGGNAKLSKGAKGMAMEIAAEAQLTDQLFGTDDDDKALKAVSLENEKDYKEFGTDVGKLLQAGKAPYRMDSFFKEMRKTMPDYLEA